METTYLNHVIGAHKLAGMFDGKWYAFVDSMLDLDIRPSKYPAVVIRRIKAHYANIFIFENLPKPNRLNNRFLE